MGEFHITETIRKNIDVPKSWVVILWNDSHIAMEIKDKGDLSILRKCLSAVYKSKKRVITDN